MRRFAKQFAIDRSGMFAVLAGILAIPILIAIGMTLDYMLISRIRAELQDAADAAAVGAVAMASPAFTAAGKMKNDGQIEDGVDDAIDIFNAQLRGDAKKNLSEVDADVQKSGTQINAVVKFQAQVPTRFMKIAGYDTIAISGKSSAETTTPLFSDFYLLLDNTPSMGIGATQDDIDTMVNNTSDKCAFACHEKSNSDNYYDLAKSLGVTMRIDVMAQATAQLMDTAEEKETYSDQFRMALYDFGEKAEKTGLRRVVKLTDNLDKIRSKATSKIDLMTVPYQNYNFDQDTDFNSALTSLAKEISSPGDGSTSSAPLKYVLFTSDGLGDYANSSTCQEKTTSGRCQEPINTSYCDAIKNRGIKIAVLYTTYYPLPTNSWYNTWIAPFEDDIGANMEDCASPGLFFSVSPTEGIAEAMTALFKKMIAEPRLTN